MLSSIVPLHCLHQPKVDEFGRLVRRASAWARRYGQCSASLYGRADLHWLYARHASVRGLRLGQEQSDPVAAVRVATMALDACLAGVHAAFMPHSATQSHHRLAQIFTPRTDAFARMHQHQQQQPKPTTTCTDGDHQWRMDELIDATTVTTSVQLTSTLRTQFAAESAQLAEVRCVNGARAAALDGVMCACRQSELVQYTRNNSVQCRLCAQCVHSEFLPLL